MNISELLQTLREDLLDDALEPYQWGNAQLVRMINEARREACRRAYLIRDSTNATETDLFSGSATSTTSDKLVDSGAAFDSTALGLTVYNTTDGTWAVVSAVDDANTLSLSSDIMASGESYIIGNPALALGRVCVVDGTASYAVSGKIRKIDVCYLASDPATPIEQVTESWLDANVYNWRALTGTPEFHVEHRGRIRLVPEPDDTINDSTGLDTLIMESYRLPIYDLTYPVTTYTAPEEPEEVHRDMLHYAAKLAFQVPDAETRNDAMAEYHEGMFSQRFGPPVSAHLEQGVIEMPALFRLTKPRF